MPCDSLQSQCGFSIFIMGMVGRIATGHFNRCVSYRGANFGQSLQVRGVERGHGRGLRGRGDGRRQRHARVQHRDDGQDSNWGHWTF